MVTKEKKKPLLVLPFHILKDNHGYCCCCLLFLSKYILFLYNLNNCKHLLTVYNILGSYLNDCVCITVPSLLVPSFVCKNSLNYHSIIWSRLLPLEGCTNNNVRKVTQLKVMSYKWFGIFFFIFCLKIWLCQSR